MKVLIADNKASCRDSLQAHVEQHQDMQVSGIAVEADGSPECAIAREHCQQAAEFDLHQSIEKLKQTWAAFREIIDVIAREEIKISREELDKQIEAQYSRKIRHVG